MVWKLQAVTRVVKFFKYSFILLRGLINSLSTVQSQFAKSLEKKMLSNYFFYSCSSYIAIATLYTHSANNQKHLMDAFVYVEIE